MPGAHCTRASLVSPSPSPELLGHYCTAKRNLSTHLYDTIVHDADRLAAAGNAQLKTAPARKPSAPKRLRPPMTPGGGTGAQRRFKWTHAMHRATMALQNLRHKNAGQRTSQHLAAYGTVSTC
jgi:hypothetical protein